jgi:hypothetical protein
MSNHASYLQNCEWQSIHKALARSFHFHRIKIFKAHQNCSFRSWPPQVSLFFTCKWVCCRFSKLLQALRSCRGKYHHQQWAMHWSCPSYSTCESSPFYGYSNVTSTLLCQGYYNDIIMPLVSNKGTPRFPWTLLSVFSIPFQLLFFSSCFSPFLIRKGFMIRLQLCRESTSEFIESEILQYTFSSLLFVNAHQKWNTVDALLADCGLSPAFLAGVSPRIFQPGGRGKWWSSSLLLFAHPGLSVADRSQD